MKTKLIQAMIRYLRTIPCNMGLETECGGDSGKMTLSFFYLTD